jgi:UDP-N-acetylmuramyl pentapeptide phosphotransferase/UDP-N-acetylglucosamine-1-phosphate transferase
MIPIYYLIDSSVTILKRIIKGKKIWEAHSEHFYQQAVRIGMNHNDVVNRINNHNMINISIVIISFRYEYISMILAILNIIILIYRITNKNVNSKYDRRDHKTI